MIVVPDGGGTPPPHKNGIDSKDVVGFRRYVFTGMLTGKDKLSALAYADMFALSFYSEGFSMAILEALATGLPVVISKQCNFPEGTEYHAGFVVETDDTDGLRQSAHCCQTTALCQDGAKWLETGEGKVHLIRIATSMTGFYRTLVADRRLENRY